ncbi:hypothetical protein CgunFtcFv8_009104 [Champsocephalus gunnari]|uniref:Cytochrome c oxidase assembly factor 3 mitochondrial coiled-coil domain-containing protein n=1 Tax=Champsocephalus gunnari TaxID=52237 RepID=A0AAN8D2K5_CHAGU|nr:hypothetical protein CgunFtcFv8_009104 [Champsocephalus gunnari]
MAEKGAEESAKASPSSGEKQLPRRKQELDYFKRNAARLRTRNLGTGLLIGAFVVGMFSYTILSSNRSESWRSWTTRPESTS